MHARYVVRILDMMQMVGVQSTNQMGRPEVSFEQFACIAALSEKVVGLAGDEKQAIAVMDFDAVEAKMTKAKELFWLECNTYGEIPLSHMPVILRAGRIAQVHEEEVLAKLAGTF